MKKTLYVIKNLGVWKSTIYLILYPLRFLRRALTKLDDLHDEIRWNKLLYQHLSKLSMQGSFKKLKYDKQKVHSAINSFSSRINFDWIHLYEELSGIKSENFIPDNIFFREIEPTLNNYSTASFYSDKNSYGILLKDFKQPDTILRFINGKYYDSNYNLLSKNGALTNINSTDEPWIIKPSVGSGGGKYVYSGLSKDGKFLVNNMRHSLNDLICVYKRGFIIQNKIKQCAELDKFHPASLNTFRVITLRLNNDINYLSCVIKFGVNDNIVDNSGTGGVWCGINPDGSMKPSGLTYRLKRISTHPTTGESFEKVYFTFFNNIVKFAKSMHCGLPHMDIVSWDIAVNQNNKPVLIEFNTKFQGIIGCQTENGPLFGDLTDDVLAEVVRRQNGNLS